MMAKADDGTGSIRLRRAYDEMGQNDGQRVLVDRMWPRGVKKDALDLTEWCKDVAPSDELRRWFAHDPDRWPEFQSRYRDELRDHEDDVARLADMAQQKRLTLVFAAKDRDRNNAVVLRSVLAERISS